MLKVVRLHLRLLLYEMQLPILCQLLRYQVLPLLQSRLLLLLLLLRQQGLLQLSQLL